MSAVCEFAPAKVNLCLHITGRREDGYHLLDSLVAFAGIGDELSIRTAVSPSLNISGPYASALSGQSDNLITRAAKGLGASAPAATVDLLKRLPVAGGIGGGSANAAAALRGFLALPDATRPAKEELDALALRLGADVPACLVSKFLRMRGIGEEIEELPPLPDLPAVLVNPGVPVPTGPVFQALNLQAGESAFEGIGAPPQGGFDTVDALCGWLAERRNDLQPPAVELVPALTDVLALIAAQKGCRLARMSGSGATCFGLFATRHDADRAADVIAATQPAWWSVATTLR
ncbi:MAG: 4-(cytidine 5'-diphospho)-2-C-methyl-D-erythritol kinase [Pseudomonadota bacterium]